MGCHRDTVVAIGGFDEQMVPSAEDDELSYRWVRAGKRIRYEPELLVWHAAWRTPAELADVYTGYARGQGKFYGKHLRAGDFSLLAPVARELYAGVRGLTDGIGRHDSHPLDPRRKIIRGLIPGLVAGWRTAGSAAESAPERGDGALRRMARRFGPLRRTWLLLRAGVDAFRDDAKRNRDRVDAEFATPDPWDYTGSLREQECLHHQQEVLDGIRGTGRFGDACEVGCAEGYFTEALADRCDSLVALDLAEAALGRARNRRDWGGNVRFARFDLRTDPLPGQFDLIVVAGVLEYFDRPSALRAARQRLVEAMRHGGWLFVVTTRNPVVERAWWASIFPRGSRINQYVGEDPRLVTRTVEEADWYVISVFERRS